MQLMPPSRPFQFRLAHMPRLRKVLMLLIIALGVAIALPALLFGWLARWWASHTWDYKERWSGIWAFAVMLGVLYALLMWLAHPLPFLLATICNALRERVWQNAGYGIAGIWLLNSLLSPVFTLVLEALHPRTQRIYLQPRCQLPYPKDAGVDDILGANLNDQQSIVLPEPLGTYHGGDLYTWVDGGVLFYPPNELKRHGAIIGEPGFGKTETALRLAMIAALYGWQVIYIDVKGSYRTAARFVAAMQQTGMRQIKTFPALSYDGWRGDTRALYNRLMAMLDRNTHPYYREVTSSVVSLALEAPEGQPRNSRQFLARLDGDWLKRAYAGKPELQAVKKLTYQELAGVFHTYNGFFRAVNGGLDGHFAFEDADAISMVLDGTSLGEEAATLGRYLLEDCSHFAVYRKRPGQHTLIIVDEFGALQTRNATDLFERVREFNTTIFVTAQSYEGLGPDVRSILGASGVKILHRCGDPEKLVAYAGTREEPVFDYAFDDLGATGAGRVRMHRGYRVQPDEVRQLPTGRCCIMTGGLAAWVQIYSLSLPADLVKAADILVKSRQPTPASPPVQVRAKHTAMSTPRSTKMVRRNLSPASSPVLTQVGMEERQRAKPTPQAVSSATLQSLQTSPQATGQSNAYQQDKTSQIQIPKDSSSSASLSQPLIHDANQASRPVEKTSDEPSDLPPLTDFFS